MPILNYTTTINADKTLGEIQRILASNGAKSIQVDYTNGRPTAVAFFAETPIGERAFVLPANVDGVWQTLVQQNRRGKVPARFATKDQASRVAWRIIKDWIAAQMAIIEAGMVTLDQVMLPYMQVGDQSFYDAVRQNQMALPPAVSQT